jgi:hypothetical protein
VVDEEARAMEEKRKKREEERQKREEARLLEEEKERAEEAAAAEEKGKEEVDEEEEEEPRPETPNATLRMAAMSISVDADAGSSDEVEPADLNPKFSSKRNSLLMMVNQGDFEQGPAALAAAAIASGGGGIQEEEAEEAEERLSTEHERDVLFTCMLENCKAFETEPGWMPADKVAVALGSESITEEKLKDMLETVLNAEDKKEGGFIRYEAVAIYVRDNQ